MATLVCGQGVDKSVAFQIPPCSCFLADIRHRERVSILPLCTVFHKVLGVDKLKLSGKNLGRVFNFSSGCVHAMQLYFIEVKLPNLKLKTWPKQLLGSLRLVIALPVLG